MWAEHRAGTIRLYDTLDANRDRLAEAGYVAPEHDDDAGALAHARQAIAANVAFVAIVGTLDGSRVGKV